jgi:hypothetical protein
VDEEGTKGEEPQDSTNNRVPRRCATQDRSGSVAPRSVPG